MTNGSHKPVSKSVANGQAEKMRASLLAWHPDVQATLSTHPDLYSPITSKSRIASFRYALAGCLYMLRYQKNIRIQSVATVLVFAIGLWLGLVPYGWALLILAIAINWMAEFTNAAIEAVVNLASPDIHPMARVAKDVAAATSLVTALAAVLVGALVMLPPLLERVGPSIVRLVLR